MMMSTTDAFLTCHGTPNTNIVPTIAASISSSSSSSTTTTTTSRTRTISSSSRKMSSLAVSASSSSTSTSTSGTSTSSNNDNYDIVHVDLSDGRDYPIYIGTSYSDEQASSMLSSHVHGNKVLIVTNDKIAPMYLEKYQKLLSADQEGKDVVTLVLPDGEEYKSMEILQLILDKALEETLDRKCTFVALGGGVIGDMVGFAAAIYQRGVNFIQIPTTVMAMVDSSVGGKTGVNHPLGKNMIGAFHQPQCVFIDTDTLSTLPDRELQSGIAEIIKYGLIRDAALFEWLEDNMDLLLKRDPSATRYAVKRSCENKAEVVKADEKEAGLRATLNLGHTFGHAIESGSGYGTWLHGEAVAIGTAMAATMSAELGWIDPDLVQRTYRLLEKANLPVELPVDSPMDRATFLRYMAADKKVANGQLRLILLKGPLGNCVFTGDFDQTAMIKTIDEFVAECCGPNS
ncbi:3-dehydroquinate synthase [Nitzschia inconspicua]|uniref:3-dehydroquinate synthase, chloroplastic n=1 Tax=Nitzschia inconspicua TaxID=303405 RepID=A0A9K3PP82_9STRA|nr:3-dehydroquinate synthase [Nitzschia inconspicua]